MAAIWMEDPLDLMRLLREIDLRAVADLVVVREAGLAVALAVQEMGVIRLLS
jgi:hypothetical protein